MEDIPEVKIHRVNFQSVSETMERFMRMGFFIAHEPDDAVDRVLIEESTRPPHHQARVLVKFDIRWKFHRAV
jgi:hypothetical protein